MSNYLKNVQLLFCAMCIFSLSACESTTKPIAVIDVNAIMSTGPHAQDAAKEIAKAQEIYQYNLNVIIKRLKTYKNKERAQEYLQAASSQLQAQHNASQSAVGQALADALNTVIAGEKNNYELILFKNNIIHANESLDISVAIQKKYDVELVAYPPLPQKVDEPNLPADTK